jgi:hypothetical protein
MRGRYLRLWLGGSVAVLAIALALFGWHAVVPAFGPATYSYEETTAQAADLPIDVPSSGQRLGVRFNLHVSALHPTWFAVRPDDCLESITVNGWPVPIREPLCFPDERAISLAGALQRGDNDVEVHILDHGGRGGLGVAVAIGDPLFLGVMGFVGLLVTTLIGYAFVALGARRLAVPAVVTIVVGLAVRLPLITHTGYGFDTGLNAHWGKSAVVLGIGPSYLHQIDDTMLPNYPPLGMAVFAATGRAYRALLSPTYDVGMRECLAFSKLPAVFADVATALVLLGLVARISARRYAPWVAGIGYALQPSVFYDSAVWGQVDSIFSLAVVGALAAALGRRWVLMGALFSAAVLLKFQAIVALPTIVALCFIERRVVAQASLGALAPALLVAAILRSWRALLAVHGVYAHSSGFFPVLSMNAYNAWIALYGSGSRDHTDAAALLGWLTYRHVGLAVFGGFAAAAAALGARRLRRATTLPARAWALFAAPAVTVYAFYLFNTEMHERYLFLLMPVGVPMVFAGPGLRSYLAASSLFFLNLVGVLPWTSLDQAAFKEFPTLPSVIGACNVLVFLTMSRMLARGRWRAPRALASGGVATMLRLSGAGTGWPTTGRPVDRAEE